jgi:hypothetical protein
MTMMGIGAATNGTTTAEIAAAAIVGADRQSRIPR